MLDDIYNANLKEDEFDKNIRPETLDDYVGQEEIKENLKVFIKGFSSRFIEFRRRRCFIY